MKFTSVALLALPLATQAAVNCCWDTECAACGENAPAGVEKTECMDKGFPSFEIWHPTEGWTCMPSGAPKLVDCCKNYDPDYVPDPDNPDDSYYYACSECEIRVPMDECMNNPEYSYFADFYHVKECKSKASVLEGDPHVKTWSGGWFDYHGECDLVMMHVDQFEDKGPFTVHARTKIRSDYSFISNAVLQIGSDTLEVASWGDYSINGVGGGVPESREGQSTLGSIAGYDIRHSHPDDKQHSFRIVLGEDEVIEFATFKDLVSVRFTGGSAQHFATTKGLMGDFSGRKVARDGTTIMEDTNAFGQEWQVQPEEGMLFVTEPAPGKCKLPSASIESSRRLRKAVSKDVAEKACFKHQGAAFDACVLDVQLTGDVAIASAGRY